MNTTKETASTPVSLLSSERGKTLVVCEATVKSTEFHEFVFGENEKRFHQAVKNKPLRKKIIDSLCEEAQERFLFCRQTGDELSKDQIWKKISKLVYNHSNKTEDKHEEASRAETLCRQLAKDLSKFMKKYDKLEPSELNSEVTSIRDFISNALATNQLPSIQGGVSPQSEVDSNLSNQFEAMDMDEGNTYNTSGTAATSAAIRKIISPLTQRTTVTVDFTPKDGKFLKWKKSTLNSRGTYHGMLANRRPNGFGSVVYSSGNFFFGVWEDGKRKAGWYVHKYDPEQQFPYPIIYEGKFNNNKMTGDYSVFFGGEDFEPVNGRRAMKRAWEEAFPGKSTPDVEAV